MKNFFLACLASLAIGSSAEALLPPLYEGISEIKSILISRELDQKLESGDVILSIQKNDNGYEIITNKHRLQVDIIYRPMPHPGPAQFELRFHDAEPVQE